MAWIPLLQHFGPMIQMRWRIYRATIALTRIDRNHDNGRVRFRGYRLSSNLAR